MEIIQEILHLVKKEGIDSSGMFDLGSKGSLIDKYINLVLSGKRMNDDEIAKKLYGVGRSDPRYKNLKKRVKKKLIQAIPMIDKEYLGFRSEYNKSYHSCMEANNRVWLLSKLAAYDTIEYLIRSFYPIAIKFQFYDILKDFSYHLIKVYTIKGNSKRAKEESLCFEKYSREENNLFQVKALYFKTSVDLVKKSSISDKELSQLETVINCLNNYTKNSESFEVQFWANYIKSHYYTLTKDTRALLENLIRIEEIFIIHKYFPPSREIAFLIQKLAWLFQLKKYDQGLSIASEKGAIIVKRQNNWSLFKRFEFYHAINIDYVKAHNIYQEILNSDFYNLNNNERTAQLWEINHAYLQFLLNYHNHPEAKRFNIYKFINEVHLYSKDKAGYNFSIIVIEMLFYLLKGDIDSYIERTTALMAYRLRHLKQKSFKRSNVFAQLLLDVEKYRFDPVKLRKISQKKYAYLASLDDRLNINEWEIIGYETLWDIVIDLLEKRKK